MSQGYVGEIRIFAGNFAPQGWAKCDGSVMPISENQTLYALLGTTYGGDGQTTFGLPDLRGRAPIHRSSTYPMGIMGGAEQVTLTAANMPAHTHAAMAGSAQGAVPTPVNAVWCASNYTSFSTGQSPDTAMNSHALQPAGGSQPHENMMPFTVVGYIICLEGIYPNFS